MKCLNIHDIDSESKLNIIKFNSEFYIKNPINAADINIINNIIFIRDIKFMILCIYVIEKNIIM
jgi:hypothetical protein